jgi:hypothetical protein
MHEDTFQQGTIHAEGRRKHRKLLVFKDFSERNRFFKRQKPFRLFEYYTIQKKRKSSCITGNIRSFFVLFSPAGLIFRRKRRKVYEAFRLNGPVEQKRRFSQGKMDRRKPQQMIRTPEAAGFYPPFFPAVSLF